MKISDSVEREIKSKFLELIENGWFEQSGSTLTETSKKIGKNPNYISLIVKKMFNLNFTDFVNNLRLASIKKKVFSGEIQPSKITLEGLAETVGFNNRRTLYSAFLKKYNQPPSKMLKEWK